MSLHQGNEYLTWQFIKSHYSLDDADKIKIKSIIKSANQEMNTRLDPIRDRLDDLTDTETFERIQNVALDFFESERLEAINQEYDLAAKKFTKFEKRIKALIISIKSKPTESKRSQQAYHGASFQSGLLHNIHGTTDEYGNLKSDRI